MLMSVKGWCGEENIWENWTCRMSGKGVGTLKWGGGAVTPYKLRTFPSYCRRREGGGGGGRIKCTREKTTKIF